MTQPDPALMLPLSGLRPKQRKLKLPLIEADIPASKRLKLIGIHQIAEAIMQGFTILEICQYLGITLKSFHHWVQRLPSEDRQLIYLARVAFYEQQLAWYYQEGLALLNQTYPFSLTDNLDQDLERIDKWSAIRAMRLEQLSRYANKVLIALNRYDGYVQRIDTSDNEKGQKTLVVSSERYQQGISREASFLPMNTN